MNRLRLACPKCQKRLVLKNHQRLGRQGKCPACGHGFMLPEIRADAAALAAEPPTFHGIEAALPIRVRKPQEPETDAADPGQPPKSDTNAFPFPLLPDAGADRLASVNRRRRQGRRQAVFSVAAVLLLVIIGLGLVFLRRVSVSPPAAEATSSARVADVSQTFAIDRSRAVMSEVVDDASPAHREPIRLFMVPSGARVLVHLRPADLWSDEGPYIELRESLTRNVSAGIEHCLREITGREPQELEAVLLAWILGARGTEPQIAAVVHLAHEERLSDLIQEFGPDPWDRLAHPRVFLLEDRAVLIRDTRTLAFAPRALAEELAEWCDTPNDNTSDGVLALLEHTDRERLLTVIFDPNEVQRHLDGLFDESVRDVGRLVTSWFAEHAETVAWSMHTGEEFTSEILLRPRSVESSSTMLDRVTENMELVPAQMVAGVRRLNPQRMGFRRLIGRFPAMLEVFRRATVSGVNDRAVRLATTLPTKAGPNLALAAVLTWDEWSGQRSASWSEPAPAPTDGDSARRTVAERLLLPLDAEFSRTPLQDAIDYIADEIDVPIDIDGDALQDAGYTKNMPQSFNLGRVSAAAALQRILQQYQEPGKEMVIVIDEQQQRAMILTKAFAARRGMEPSRLRP